MPQKRFVVYGRHVTATDVAVDALATYRLTRLVQRDTLPPVVKFREAVRAADPRPPDWALELLECPWCLSVWVGLCVSVARRVAPRSWSAVGAALAASAVTGIVMTTLDVED